MSALVKTIDLGKTPKLNNWIGDSDGLLRAYVRDLQKYIPGLLSAQANMTSEEPSADFEALGNAVRLMGCLAADMAIIEKELYG